jgi:hypothetical protein
MSNWHIRIRTLAAAVTLAAGALLLSAKPALAGRFCTAQESYCMLVWAEFECNEHAPPYYCAYESSCWVNDEEQIEYDFYCVYYDDYQPCPAFPGTC